MDVNGAAVASEPARLPPAGPSRWTRRVEALQSEGEGECVCKMLL